MKKIFFIFLVFFGVFSQLSFAQEDNIKIGSVNRPFSMTGGAYDYSEVSTVNVKLAIWGFVRFPGRYTVPANTKLSTLISYAGGPVVDALLEDVRVIRTLGDSTQQVFTFNYNELLFEPNVKTQVKDMVLLPGDVVVLPGEPRFFFKDYLTMTLSIVSTLVSLSILILNIVKK